MAQDIANLAQPPEDDVKIGKRPALQVATEILQHEDRVFGQLQDLLGLSIDFGQVLPDDGKSKTGFTNNGVLQSSCVPAFDGQSVAGSPGQLATSNWKRPSRPVTSSRRTAPGTGSRTGNGLSSSPG